MPDRKLAVFIVKRVLICYILLSIIVMVFVKEKWFVLGGLTAGGIFSVLKINSYIWVFSRTLSAGNSNIGAKAATGGSIVVFALNQIILLPLLYLAYILNQWFFAGTVAGILLVPFVIWVNCVTEATGITKNNFE